MFLRLFDIDFWFPCRTPHPGILLISSTPPRPHWISILLCPPVIGDCESLSEAVGTHIVPWHPCQGPRGDTLGGDPDLLARQELDPPRLVAPVVPVPLIPRNGRSHTAVVETHSQHVWVLLQDLKAVAPSCWSSTRVVRTRLSGYESDEFTSAETNTFHTSVRERSPELRPSSPFVVSRTSPGRCVGPSNPWQFLPPHTVPRNLAGHRAVSVRVRIDLSG